MTAKESHAAKIDESRSRSDRLRSWRREKVWEYRSMGLAIDEIVEKLKAKPEVKISHGTVINDLKAKQEQVEKNLEHYIEKDLPMQHNLAVTGLDKVIKEAWQIYGEASDKKTQLAALAVIADATMKKQAVLGDPAQIQKAIKVVAQLRKQMEASH